MLKDHVLYGSYLSKEPIAPGAKGVIELNIFLKRRTAVYKTITLTSNEVVPTKTLLYKSKTF
jgi:hypothetical protein